MRGCENILIFSRLGTEHRKLVRLWTEVLTGCEGWNKDNNYLYLLDILARFSFQHEDCRTFFYEFFIEFFRVSSEKRYGQIVAV